MFNTIEIMINIMFNTIKIKINIMFNIMQIMIMMIIFNTMQIMITMIKNNNFVPEPNKGLVCNMTVDRGFGNNWNKKISHILHVIFSS